MKNWLVNLAGLALIGGVVFWVLHHAPGAEALSGHASYLEAARSFHALHPGLSVAAFCAAHLIASIFGIPGGCTLLNILSGATFGFWKGCAVVYPVTMLSATLVFAAAQILRRPAARRLMSKSLATRARELFGRLGPGDYWYLVALRLSPLIPFGLLNLLLGLAGLPFTVYFLSTLVGIFFDVTLLNSLGAGTAVNGSPQSHVDLAVVFLVLAATFGLVRYRLGRLA